MWMIIIHGQDDITAGGQIHPAIARNSFISSRLEESAVDGWALLTLVPKCAQRRNPKE